ncbi:MAG: MBL fold metallo-hydrolase [Clostridia bacterium]|nr:MBL fold metallo-hydrolase [Clostridia bacterium]
MRVATLASSSKGNSTLLWTDNTKILIDLGITCSEVELKLKALNIDPKQIDAILNTHVHSDHTKGIATFARKYGTKIYCHIDGAQALATKLEKVKQEQLFSYSDKPFSVGDFEITSFKLPHDVDCCVGYTVACGDTKVSYATDLGHKSDETLLHLFGSKLVILESNHDRAMLIANPHYSPILKTRILSSHGHLSNDDCAVAVAKLALAGTKQVVLAHLSEENNTPETAYECVTNYLNSRGISEGVNIKIDVAPAHKIGTIFNLK